MWSTSLSHFLYLDIRKYLRNGVSCLLWYIKFIFVCVSSIGFWLQTSYRGVIHRSLSWIDGNRCVPLTSYKSILLFFHLLLASPSPIGNFCVYLRQNGLLSEKIMTDVFWCCEIHLIRSIFSLISGVTALQKALVMMHVSGRNVLVSIIVLVCILTFELQSESSAKVFHVS